MSIWQKSSQKHVSPIWSALAVATHTCSHVHTYTHSYINFIEGVSVYVNVHLPYANIYNFELRKTKLNIPTICFAYSMCTYVHMSETIYVIYTYICVYTYSYIYFSCLQLNFNSHHLQHQQNQGKQIAMFRVLVLFLGLLCGRRCARLFFGSIRFDTYISTF